MSDPSATDGPHANGGPLPPSSCQATDFPGGRRSRLLAANPWLTFVLPLAVFMAAGSFEPTSDKDFELLGLTIASADYPLVYCVKIALTMAAIALVWPGYRQFPFRISSLALLIGIAGGPLYVGLCKLRLESMLLTPIGLGWVAEYGQRSAFNPLANWPDQPLLGFGFLAVRFWGLVAIVPVIEEFFLRGFVMRFVIAPDWWKIPFGTLTPTAIAVGTLLPILTHPVAESLAAAAWFTLMTWLMFKTRNIWDCIAAHAITNLLLGIYVVAYRDWMLL